jgi:zinc D-Ala-D-Ala carboxypeptidase
MNLSPHFTLDEMTVSQTAARKGLDNTPSEAVIAKMRKTAQGLEGVRIVLGGAPIIISSGYRSPAVNAAVGGARVSQHLTGEAVDFTSPRFGSVVDVFTAIRRSGIKYDQLIQEFGSWVHISFSDSPRGQALIIDRNGTRPA